jgi:hypothetical protein
MTDHKVGTREEWLAARLQLLEAEKAQTRRGDELSKMRQELPWVRIPGEAGIGLCNRRPGRRRPRCGRPVATEPTRDPMAISRLDPDAIKVASSVEAQVIGGQLDRFNRGGLAVRNLVPVFMFCGDHQGKLRRPSPGTARSSPTRAIGTASPGSQPPAV